MERGEEVCVFDVDVLFCMSITLDIWERERVEETGEEKS